MRYFLFLILSILALQFSLSGSNGPSLKKRAGFLLKIFSPADTNIKGKDKMNSFPDKKAEYPGGMDKLNKDLSANLVYPKAAQKKNIKGKVYVSFIVEKDGSVDSVKVTKGMELGNGLPESAKYAVQKLKRFHPAIMKGMPVKTYMFVPITFDGERKAAKKN